MRVHVTLAALREAFPHVGATAEFSLTSYEAAFKFPHKRKTIRGIKGPRALSGGKVPRPAGETLRKPHWFGPVTLALTCYVLRLSLPGRSHLVTLLSKEDKRKHGEIFIIFVSG